MPDHEQFVAIVRSEFPEDRLTFQKSIPTFHPESADEAASFFRLLNRHHRKTFITSFGNNIDPVGERFAGMVTVRTDRLNQLIEVAPEDFYIRAGAGYPLREINLHQAERGLFLPHSSLPYVGSVGGAIGVNLSADHHGHDLPIKRYLIMATIVTPLGEIIRPGSVCFKSVSGLDIVKLYAGSWGLLGLVVDATFRVMPVTAASEFVGLRQKGIDREPTISGLKADNDATDAVYSRKIKDRFDPNLVLPVV
ncbi:MAG: FAD-binding oxidoreductase [bacterium]|nr:FAD-binding oxidoreductase [bacterium]